MAFTEDTNTLVSLVPDPPTTSNKDGAPVWNDYDVKWQNMTLVWNGTTKNEFTED